MNTTDLIFDFCELSPMALDPDLLLTRVLLRYLADHVHDATLKNGLPVRDVTDFDMWLRELADEARNVVSTKVQSQREISTRPAVTAPASQARWDSQACPDCSHEHQPIGETCGHYLGEGKFCRCPSKVAA